MNTAFDILLDVVRKILGKCANFGLSYENFSQRVYFILGHSLDFYTVQLHNKMFNNLSCLDNFCVKCQSI